MDASSLVSNHLRNYHNGSAIRTYYKDVAVDTSDDASMDKIHVTYVADEHDTHDYDDSTDDDNDIVQVKSSQIKSD